jgi:hypothetical protein
MHGAPGCSVPEIVQIATAEDAALEKVLGEISVDLVLLKGKIAGSPPAAKPEKGEGNGAANTTPPAAKTGQSEGNGGKSCDSGPDCFLAGPRTIKVFISYSHDSTEHCEHVLQLAEALRSQGIDAELDRYHVGPPEGWPHWCARQLEPENSDFVLMICTETYQRRVEKKECADEGQGVFWEGSIIYAYIYGAKANTRFIPVLLPGATTDCIPIPIRSFTYYQIGQIDLVDDGYQRLYRELTKQPAITKPTLGEVIPLAPQPVKTTFPTPVAESKRDAG